VPVGLMRLAPEKFERGDSLPPPPTRYEEPERELVGA